MSGGECAFSDDVVNSGGGAAAMNNEVPEDKKDGYDSGVEQEDEEVIHYPD